MLNALRLHFIEPSDYKSKSSTNFNSKPYIILKQNNKILRLEKSSLYISISVYQCGVMRSVADYLDAIMKKQ